MFAVAYGFELIGEMSTLASISLVVPASSLIEARINGAEACATCGGDQEGQHGEVAPEFHVYHILMTNVHCDLFLNIYYI